MYTKLCIFFYPSVMGKEGLPAMTAPQRREQILAILQQTDAPVSATALAGRLGVSRQIVVGDVALLRAGGKQILATPRGYLLEGRSSCTATLACCHDTGEKMLEEFYAVVDQGGRVEDVTVENPLYGQITGQLQIGTRYEAQEFVRRANRDPDGLLLNMAAGGVHLHTISAPDPESLERIRRALAQAGILYET